MPDTGTRPPQQTDWPYDADRDDPLTALRIAVVSHAWPRWYYLVAFDLDQIDDDRHRPDDHEAALLSSFLDEYINRWYGDTWKAKLAERPFDIDGGANGYIFRKWGDDDWGYRQHSWTVGPCFWPGPDWYRQEYGKGIPESRAYPLSELMDHIHSRGSGRVAESWVEWKASHPDVFGGDQ